MADGRTSDGDYSQTFEEDERLQLSFGSDSQPSASSAGTPTARNAHTHSVSLAAPACSRKRETAGLRSKEDDGLKFRAAAKKVTAMQSVSKTFSDSLQVREAVYTEWLERKSKVLQNSQRLQQEQRMSKEAALKQKSGVKVERSKRVIQEWHKRKHSELTERQKQVKERAREKEEAETEKERKKEASTVAHKEWEKLKSQHLVAQQRRHKRKQERLKQEKEAETKERVGDSNKAFDTWKKRKEEVIKQNVGKVREENRQKQKSEAEQKTQKAKEVGVAVKRWEAKKRQRSCLETQDRARDRPETSAPRPAWCPARTMHHVPSNRLSRIQTSRRQSLSSRQTQTQANEAEDTYSLDSFPGSEVVSSEESEGSRQGETTGDSSSGHFTSDSAANRTGTLKTVQVCCRTLKYWCTCSLEKN